MAVIERWLLRSGDVAAYILRFHCIGNEFVNLGNTPMYSAKLWSKGLIFSNGPDFLRNQCC